MREITVQQLQEKLINNEEVAILDIRELHELQTGIIPGVIHRPMFDLVHNHSQLLEKETIYYIVCEHGVRSVNLIAYLSQFGYNLCNVIEGTEMYSRYFPLDKYREVK